MSENPADNPPPADPPAADPIPRTKKGQFAPKTNGQKPPEPTAEPSTETKDALLDDIEKDLRDSLNKETDLSDLEGIDQRTRIRLLRVLSKNLSNKKTPKDPINPLTPPPPVEKPIPTLLERNRRDKYIRDMNKRGSYVDVIAKMRGNQS